MGLTTEQLVNWQVRTWEIEQGLFAPKERAEHAARVAREVAPVVLPPSNEMMLDIPDGLLK